MCDDLRVTMELVRGSMVPGGHQPAGWDLSPWGGYHGGHGEYRGPGLWHSGETDFRCSGGEIEAMQKETKDLEPGLRSEDTAKQLFGTEDLLKEHGLVETRLNALRFSMLSLNQHAQPYTKSLHPVAPLLQKKLDVLNKELEAIYNLSAARKAALEEACLFDQFERDSEEDETWLLEKIRLMESADVGRVLEACTSLMKKHECLKSDVARRQQVSERIQREGEQLITNRHQNTPFINQRLQSLRDKWTKLDEFIARRTTLLNDALESHQNDASVTDQSLGGGGNGGRGRSESPTSQEEKETLQKELGSLQAKLQSTEEKVNELQEMLTAAPRREEVEQFKASASEDSARLQHALEELAVAVYEKDNNIANLNSQVATLNTQIVELTKAKESAETRVKQLLTDGGSCTCQIADLQANFSELEKQEMKSQNHGIDGSSAKNLSLRNQRRKEGKRSDEEWRRVCRGLLARARRLRGRQEQRQAREKNEMQSQIMSLQRDRERLAMELVSRETESIPAQVKVDVQDLHGELELRKAERNVKISPNESALHSLEDFTDSAADVFFHLNSKCDDLEQGMVGTLTSQTSTSHAVYNSTRPPEVHFIGGEDISYNSNSGFMNDHLRFNPQAFSHFTSRTPSTAPPDIVINCRMSSCDDYIEQGLGYMDEAAKRGDRSDMFLARAHETGMNLGTQRKQSHSDAVNWYDKACQMANSENGENKEECHGTIAPWITGEPSTTPRPPPSSWGDPVLSPYQYQQTTCPLTPEVLGLPQHSRPPNHWAEC